MLACVQGKMQLELKLSSEKVHMTLNNVSQDTACPPPSPHVRHGVGTRCRPCEPPEKNVKIAPNKTYKLTSMQQCCNNTDK